MTEKKQGLLLVVMGGGGRQVRSIAGVPGVDSWGCRPSLRRDRSTGAAWSVTTGCGGRGRSEGANTPSAVGGHDLHGPHRRPLNGVGQGMTLLVAIDELDCRGVDVAGVGGAQEVSAAVHDAELGVGAVDEELDFILGIGDGV